MSTLRHILMILYRGNEQFTTKMKHIWNFDAYNKRANDRPASQVKPKYRAQYRASAVKI